MMDDIDLDASPEPRERMLDKAWRRVSRALDTGRSVEAVRWMRVHAQLLAAERTDVRHAGEPIHAITRRARDGEAEAVASLRQIQAETPFLKGEVHTVHSKKSTPAPPDPDEPGLGRAERRRRLKYRGRSL